MNLIFLISFVYLITLIILFIYGANSLVLVYFYKRNKLPQKKNLRLTRYPFVTIQLPVYNELYVVERSIRKTAEIDYPRDKLEIQVLDDSTDETSSIIEKVVLEFKDKGYNIYHIRRNIRSGFKAGALGEGLRTAKGEFIAIFDADFLPDKSFLNKCIPAFQDPKVGIVQTRWDHINKDYSLFTKIQAISIDGHFQVEQNGRYGAGLLISFNGSAGVWRRECIREAGGWDSDTLTEDLDLSYRAQLKGWKLVFLPEVVSPAEIPVQINAFKRQQFRWAKGYIQCTRKLIPTILKGDIPVFQKIEAMIHLTCHLTYPLMIILFILIMPLILSGTNLHFFSFFALGSLGPLILYAVSQKELYENWWKRLLYLPFLIILGTGISANNTVGVIEAIINKRGIFQRTPKFRIEKNTDGWRAKKYKLSLPGITLAEILLGFYGLIGVYFAVEYKNYLVLPLLFLYILGYFYVAFLSIAHSIRFDFGKRISKARGISFLYFGEDSGTRE